MTDRVSLFDEMTAQADSLREANPDVLREELWIEFKAILAARCENLNPERALAAFNEWIELYLARLMARRERALAQILSAIDAAVMRNGEGIPFRCPCGMVLQNPSDPDVMRVHAPHVQAVSAIKRAASR